MCPKLNRDRAHVQTPDALSTDIRKAYAVPMWMPNIGVGSNAGVWEVQKENQRFLFEEYIFWEAGKYSVAVYCP
jgi:hypothetical protein